MRPTTSFRRETDSMGPVEVPADAYYGASTMRAVQSFPISGWRFGRRFIRALGLIKGHAAEVNAGLGLVPREVADAICRAAAEVTDGGLDDHFVVDIFQTGSGTSTNMNANEVIANRAAELMGGERGSKLVHPNDQVNCGQSSNDVIPTAIHISALLALHEDLLPALEGLEDALRAKANELWPVVKTGRTHLQDATPIRLGQEMLGYAGQIERARERLARAGEDLGEVALGGTAVGTGLNTDPTFAAGVCARLSASTGLAIRETDNHFQAQSTIDTMTACSAAVRGTALAAYKIASDLSLLGSGPRAGLGEVSIPEIQPGSSIMPGKVNPVIPEALIQVCAQVVGNDAGIAFASVRSILELNTMLPVVGHNLVQSIELLAAGTRIFTERCIEGLRATDHGPALLEKGLALATALAPIVGYDAAAGIAKQAAATGRTIREVARERTDLSDRDLARILDGSALTGPTTPATRFQRR